MRVERVGGWLRVEGLGFVAFAPVGFWCAAVFGLAAASDALNELTLWDLKEGEQTLYKVAKRLQSRPKP